MTDEQHKDILRALASIDAKLKTEEKRDPIDETIQVSATQPWTVDYHERKHIFLWIPGSALTLSFDDYGSGPVAAQQWFNLGMPVGSKMVAVGQTTPVAIMLRFTDEGLP